MSAIDVERRSDFFAPRSQAPASSPTITADEDFNQSMKNKVTLNKTGMIYYFTINLNDGSSIYFQYALK